MVKAAPKTDDDDYDFEDIETTKLRHGIKPRAQKRVVGHSWGEIALGTALSCGQMGVFGALMGLSVGAITGEKHATDILACLRCTRQTFWSSSASHACTQIWRQAPFLLRKVTDCRSPSP